MNFIKKLNAGLFVVPFILATGCCTKEDCSSSKPTLYIHVKHTSGNFLLAIYRNDGFNSFKVYEQFHEGTGSKTISYWPEYSYRDAGPFENKLLFKVNDTLIDSITNFRFDWPTATIPCGTCFPFGKGKTDTRVVKNVSYIHKGQTFGVSDTVYVEF